jgi:hypothetical protein
MRIPTRRPCVPSVRRLKSRPSYQHYRSRCSGLGPRSKRSSHTRSSHAYLPVRWTGRTHLLGECSFCKVPVQARPIPLRRAHGAIYKYHSRVAWVADSAMGLFLSLELLLIVGIFFVFLDNQLFDGRGWRSASPREVADSGGGRECYWRTDVWILRKLHLCGYDPAR